MNVRRLVVGDERLARQTFEVMSAVFETESTLDDAWVKQLLARREFFAVAALDGEVVLGGVTAHVLPMTRSASSELFVYDLAVKPEHQRRGIGRALMKEVRALASAEGVTVSFVPADEEDEHALDFYRALGGAEARASIFTFE